MANYFKSLAITLQTEKTSKCSYCCFRGLLELTNFQEGFREALPYWLNQAFSTTQDRVERAVQVDQVTLVFWCFTIMINIVYFIHRRHYHIVC